MPLQSLFSSVKDLKKVFFVVDWRGWGNRIFTNIDGKIAVTKKNTKGFFVKKKIESIRVFHRDCINLYQLLA